MSINTKHNKFGSCNLQVLRVSLFRAKTPTNKITNLQLTTEHLLCSTLPGLECLRAREMHTWHGCSNVVQRFYPADKSLSREEVLEEQLTYPNGKKSIWWIVLLTLEQVNWGLIESVDCTVCELTLALV